MASAAAFARDIDRDETRGTDRATQFETEAIIS